MPDFAALADAGWPALERVPIAGRDGRDGWVARFAGGVTSRANSVLPIGPVDDQGAAIGTAESLYRSRGLRPVFQLTERDPGLERELLARGYAAESETLVLAAEAARVTGSLPGAAITAVEVSDEPDDAWLDLWWAIDGRGGEPERRVVRSIMVGVPALYATARDAEGAASVGRLALVACGDRVWGGLYALATRADARGRGHAGAVIAALLGEGTARGVSDVWLQVLAGNAAARRLYDRLGFARVDAYRYLAAPIG